MIEDCTYTLTAISAFTPPEVYANLSLREARDLAWELKNQQYKVTIEQEDFLHEVGVCGMID